MAELSRTEQRWKRWQRRLEELARDYAAPGASLAVLHDGAVHTAATGVLNLDTGVEVTPDSLFQIGSTTKAYTATMIMRLVEAGDLDIDAPVIEVMPEFRVADPDVTKSVTPRHLLLHTSGIAGDHFADTGPGDDAIERFVAGCAEVGQDAPLGKVYSYSNTGYVILGRLIERVTGGVWEQAIREQLLEPMGLAHTTVTAEEALRHRTAFGHVGESGQLQLSPVWGLPRSISPAGARTCASATDLVAFGRVFLDGGRLQDGTSVLSEDTVASMLDPQTRVPPLDSGAAKGLGWTIVDRGGRTVLELGGATPGQRTFFEAVPDRGVIIVLQVNGGPSRDFAHVLYRELQQELCDIDIPPKDEPVFAAKSVRLDGVVGRYERFGTQTDVEVLDDGTLRGTDRLIEPLASQIPMFEPVSYELRPSSAGDGVFLSRDSGGSNWERVVFLEVGGEWYMHAGGRAARKVA